MSVKIAVGHAVAFREASKVRFQESPDLVGTSQGKASRAFLLQVNAKPELNPSHAAELGTKGVVQVQVPSSKLDWPCSATFVVS